jgi:hypothetical protein
MERIISTPSFLMNNPVFPYGTRWWTPMIFKDEHCQHGAFKQISPGTCHPFIGCLETAKNLYGFATVLDCIGDELEGVQGGK